MHAVEGCSSLRVAQDRSRREFLRAGGLGLFGLGLPTLLKARGMSAGRAEGTFGRAKACIVLFMWGGPRSRRRGT